MAERKRLIGKDGKVYRGVKGTEVTGNGTTVLTKGAFYVPTAIATADSGFPTGVKVGRVFVGDGVSTPTADDKYIELTLISQCDVTSASVEFDNDEIDVTTLCDEIKKYRSGFTDASGSIEGITTLDLTESTISKFVSVQKQDNTGAITTIEKNDDVLILALELNKIDNSDADRAIFFTPAVLNGYNLEVAIEDAQTFTSDFRIAQDNEIQPVLVEADKALFAALGA